MRFTVLSSMVLVSLFCVFLFCCVSPSADQVRAKAERGDIEAQGLLGYWYSKGEGVPEDHGQAVKWFRKAATQGNAGAQYNLGFMYYKGHGVHRNYNEAIKWYRKAADRGFSYAHYNLGNMFFDGIGVPANYTKGYAYWKVAAALKVEPAKKKIKFIHQSHVDIMSESQIAEGDRMAESMLRRIRKSDNSNVPMLNEK